jgi:hypothetical protein
MHCDKQCRRATGMPGSVFGNVDHGATEGLFAIGAVKEERAEPSAVLS